MLDILFVPNKSNVDYQSFCLLHGFYSLDGIRIHLERDVPWLFTDYADDTSNLYGKGYNTTKLIDPVKRIIDNKEDILRKIKAHEYDLIVYGCCHDNLAYLQLTINNYRKDENYLFQMRQSYQIKTNFGKDVMYPRIYLKQLRKAIFLRTKGIYFKREISKPYSNYFYPISFAIPEEKIVNSRTIKTRVDAFMYPGRKETYIYKTEDAYNKGYQEARFGVTFKKAGWDCYRHYEILANNCIPYFPDLNNLPQNTMANFPRSIIRETNILHDNMIKNGVNEENEKLYYHYLNALMDYTKDNLTTRALALYVLLICNTGKW